MENQPKRPDVVIVAYSGKPTVAVFINGVMASAGLEYINFEGYANEKPELTIRFDPDTFVNSPNNKETFEEFYEKAKKDGMWEPVKKEADKAVLLDENMA